MLPCALTRRALRPANLTSSAIRWLNPSIAISLTKAHSLSFLQPAPNHDIAADMAPLNSGQDSAVGDPGSLESKSFDTNQDESPPPITRSCTEAANIAKVSESPDSGSSASLADGTIVLAHFRCQGNRNFDKWEQKFVKKLSVINQFWNNHSQEIRSSFPAKRFGIFVRVTPVNHKIILQLWDIQPGPSWPGSVVYILKDRQLSSSLFLEGKRKVRARMAQHVKLALQNFIGTINQAGALERLNPSTVHPLFFEVEDWNRKFGHVWKSRHDIYKTDVLLFNADTAVTQAPCTRDTPNTVLLKAAIVWQWWQQSQSLFAHTPGDMFTNIRIMSFEDTENCFDVEIWKINLAPNTGLSRSVHRLFTTESQHKFSHSITEMAETYFDYLPGLDCSLLWYLAKSLRKPLGTFDKTGNLEDDEVIGQQCLLKIQKAYSTRVHDPESLESSMDRSAAMIANTSSAQVSQSPHDDSASTPNIPTRSEENRAVRSSRQKATQDVQSSNKGLADGSNPPKQSLHDKIARTMELAGSLHAVSIILDDAIKTASTQSEKDFFSSKLVDLALINCSNPVLEAINDDVVDVAAIRRVVAELESPSREPGVQRQVVVYLLNKWKSELQDRYPMMKRNSTSEVDCVPVTEDDILQEKGPSVSKKSHKTLSMSNYKSIDPHDPRLIGSRTKDKASSYWVPGIKGSIGKVKMQNFRLERPDPASPQASGREDPRETISNSSHRLNLKHPDSDVEEKPARPPKERQNWDGEKRWEAKDEFSDLAL